MPYLLQNLIGKLEIELFIFDFDLLIKWGDFQQERVDANEGVIELESARDAEELVWTFIIIGVSVAEVMAKLLAGETSLA